MHHRVWWCYLASVLTPGLTRSNTITSCLYQEVVSLRAEMLIYSEYTCSSWPLADCYLGWEGDRSMLVWWWGPLWAENPISAAVEKGPGYLYHSCTVHVGWVSDTHLGSALSNACVNCDSIVLSFTNTVTRWYGMSIIIMRLMETCFCSVEIWCAGDG